jgi:hypothetical protein
MGPSLEIDAHVAVLSSPNHHRTDADPFVQVNLVAPSTALEECAHTQIPILTRI